MLELTLAAFTVDFFFLLRALHTWIVQYLHINSFFEILQALSSGLLIIARQPFSSLAIDFQANLSNNFN